MGFDAKCRHSPEPAGVAMVPTGTKPGGEMRPDVVGFFDEETFTVSYVVADPVTKACAIIDSVLDFDPASGRTAHRSAERIEAHVAAQGLKVEWVLETHVHADHLSACHALRDRK